jgi:hypothetical protein
VFFGGSFLTTADANVTSGGTLAAGRTMLGADVKEAMRQDGYVRRVTIYVAVVGSAPTANLKFKVLRKNGTSYDLMAQSEYLTAYTTGANVFELATPMLVEPGDFIGLWIKGGAAGVCTTLKAFATPGSLLRYTGIDAAGGETYIDVSDLQLLTAYEGMKPFLVCHGESIIEGHNGATNWHSFAHSPFGPAGDPAAEPLNQVRALISGLDYQNNAIGGSLWSSVVARAGVTATYFPPRAALVACGVNDVLAGTSWASVEASMNAMKAALAAGTKIFICEMLPYPGTDAQAATIRTWNANYAAWCLANGATLIPCWDAMGQVRGSTGFKDDLITAYHYAGSGHLTVPAGVNAYAALIAAGLRSVLWL